MRAVYLLLSIAALLLAGTYSVTTLWPNYFAEENHQPLDSLADELVSNSEMGISINRSLDSVETYLKADKVSESPAERERLEKAFKQNRGGYRDMMKESMKSLLLHSLTREDLIEINRLYKKESGKKLAGVMGSTEEKQILGLAWKQLNQLQEQSSISARSPASAPSPTSTPKPSPSPSPTSAAVKK
jgi:hypothetical protein